MPTVPAQFFLPSAQFRAAYLDLGVAELRRRAEEALELLRSCVVCPRDCRVNRLEDRYAVCKTGRWARVSSFFPHLGEEDCLRGWRGSGTIFFAWCNLKCAFCLGPDVRVLTDRGMRRIEDLFLSTGHEVEADGGCVRFPQGLRLWTGQGEPTTAVKIFRHEHDGEVVVIKPVGLPALTATPEHTIFATRSPEGTLQKVPAGALTRDHYLIVSIPKPAGSQEPLSTREVLAPYVGTFRRSVQARVPVRVLQEVLIAGSRSETTPEQIGDRLGYHPAYVRTLRSRLRRGALRDEELLRNDLVESNHRIRFKTEHRPGIPSRIVLDTNLARLLGYFCAEGYVTRIARRPNSYRVVFSFGRHERSLAQRTRRLIRSVFRIHASVVTRRTTVTVEVGSTSLALFFRSLCGTGARQKRIPEVLFRSPDDVLRAFLEAYLEGDGTRHGAYLAASTVSEELASGLLGLFLRLGVFPYFYATPRPRRQTIQGRTVRQAETLYSIKCRYDAWHGQATTGRVLFREDIGTFLVPIRRIERQYYRGPVYNLEVEHPDHSYVANGIAVGNCQNFDISHLGQGRVTSPGDLARMMVFLQEQGCHNINFVTPEHVVPQILEALPQAVELGLCLPIVYNTSAYDSLHSLRLLDGIVDIYMPDFKFWDREMSRLYLKAPDYPDVARRVIAEMHRQVGPLKLDERGLARRGVLLRHLVMPGGVAGSGEIFRWIAREVSVHTYVNIMDQYYPAGRVGVDRRYDTINRRILPEEYAAAVHAAREAGLYRLDARLPRHPRLAWIPA